MPNRYPAAKQVRRLNQMKVQGAACCPPDSWPLVGVTSHKSRPHRDLGEVVSLEELLTAASEAVHLPCSHAGGRHRRHQDHSGWLCLSDRVLNDWQRTLRALVLVIPVFITLVLMALAGLGARLLMIVASAYGLHRLNLRRQLNRAQAATQRGSEDTGALVGWLAGQGSGRIPQRTQRHHNGRTHLILGIWTEPARVGRRWYRRRNSGRLVFGLPLPVTQLSNSGPPSADVLSGDPPTPDGVPKDQHQARESQGDAGGEVTHDGVHSFGLVAFTNRGAPGSSGLGKSTSPSTTSARPPSRCQTSPPAGSHR